MRSGRSRTTGTVLVGAALLLGSLVGCTDEPQANGAAPAPATPTASTEGRVADPNLVTWSGIGDIEIGASQDSLEAAGLVRPGNGSCGPTFPDLPYATPVFDDGRLVLVWAHAPLRTPERVMEGTPLAEARAAYPDAEELTRAPDDFQFPGLLVPGPDDRAYLLLHDGETVQKLIIGFEEHARLLFETGFGSC
ncbi:MAG TPA: hypothetical protein VK028_09010 [Micromonosporaceae bacterium]|nr:hypothetical protein [Micromonosporaceae bacterium]